MTGTSLRIPVTTRVRSRIPSGFQEVLNDAIRDAVQTESQLVVVLKRRGVVGIASHQKSSGWRPLVAVFGKRDLAFEVDRFGLSR
jgi:hypothetical protein